MRHVVGRWLSSQRSGVKNTISLGWVLVFSSAGIARASVVYDSHLQGTYDAFGGCMLCHTDTSGGNGTITRKFGKTLQGLGLRGSSDYASAEVAKEALDAAIAALGTADSDADGASDFEELTGSGDPNDPKVVTGGAQAPEPVEYGCIGGTIAGRTDVGFPNAVVAAGFALVMVTWRRRRGEVGAPARCRPFD